MSWVLLSPVTSDLSRDQQLSPPDMFSRERARTRVRAWPTPRARPRAWAVRAFYGPLADISVSDRSLNVCLAEMRRALVAHDALCFMLAEVGVEMPIGKLVTAIPKAARWLRYFNYAANRAKHHGSGLPFRWLVPRAPSHPPP